MSTATDKAIPTWGEVKNIASQKQYHWMWYYDIPSVSTTATSFTYTDAKSLNGNTIQSHSSTDSVLFQLSLGDSWQSGNYCESPRTLYPIYSCILPPCNNVHGKVCIKDYSFTYNGVLLMFSNMVLSLTDYSFKRLSLSLASNKAATFTSTRVFWEAQQLTTV